MLFPIRGGVMPRQSPYTILLADDEQERLEALAARYTAPYFEVVRAKIILYAALGLENQEIAARLELPRQVVSKWRKRFFTQRFNGLDDAPRSGRPPGFSPSQYSVASMPTVTGPGNAPSQASTDSSEVESCRISARIAPDSSRAQAVM